MNKRQLLLCLFCLTVFSQDWKTDFDLAKKLASESHKKIILVFQGSDWCAPCRKLDRNVWTSETFINYATKNYIMLQADFPRKEKNALSTEQQKKNNLLAEKYNKNGYFPFVVILDNEGNILGETGYKKLTPTEYIAHLEEISKKASK